MFHAKGVQPRISGMSRIFSRSAYRAIMVLEAKRAKRPQSTENVEKPRKQISQRKGRSVGHGGGESAVVIFGFRVGICPVFAGDVSNRAAMRGRRRNGDKVVQNKIGNLALFLRRQCSNFVQNRLRFCAHGLSSYTFPLSNASVAAKTAPQKPSSIHARCFQTRNGTSAFTRLR